MIKAGMTIAEAIMQLTRGFMKVTGRQPDGLEKIKINQEARQKVKDLNKVVDMEGNVLDPSKTIMGGKQDEGIMKVKPKESEITKRFEKEFNTKLYGDETFDELMYENCRRSCNNTSCW